MAYSNTLTHEVSHFFSVCCLLAPKGFASPLVIKGVEKYILKKESIQCTPQLPLPFPPSESNKGLKKCTEQQSFFFL